MALANVYLQALQPESALATIAAIRALPSPSPVPAETDLELVRLEAAAYYARTNYAAAEKALLAAQAKYPDHLSVLDALVMFYGKTKRLTNAFETIDRILKLSPDNPQALINLATLHFNNTNFPQAISVLDRIIQKDPKNIPALLYRVFMYSESKDPKKAMQDVERVLDLERDNVEGLLYQGALNIETKNYDAALPPLNRLLKLQPNNWKALRNRAIAYLHRGKLSEAQADYETLRRQLPRYYIAYYGLGEIAYRRQDTAGAIRNYELYLRYVPNVDSPEMAEEKKVVTQRLQELKAARR
jgi:tetratricopeptide (TPR) repeat protein